MQPDMGARAGRSLTGDARVPVPPMRVDAGPPAVRAMKKWGGSQAGSSAQRWAAGDAGEQHVVKAVSAVSAVSQHTDREPGEPSESVDEAETAGTAEADNDVASGRTQQRMRPNVITRVLNWLRAGYPEGVPRSDYLALYAVLRRHLSDSEIETIAEEVARANPDTDITRDDIEVAVARFAKQQPEPADVARVAEGLADAGWPLADPPWGQQ